MTDKNKQKNKIIKEQYNKYTQELIICNIEPKRRKIKARQYMMWSQIGQLKIEEKYNRK